MTHRADTQDYRQLFLNSAPIMDVRAPVEFHQGAFPNAINVPLLDDVQRHAIGCRYKDQGQQAAIDLGWEMLTPHLDNRVAQWAEFANQNPQGYLYCFRGGLRSQLTQKILRDRGIDYPLITGGYKAMRRYLLEELRNNIATIPFIVIAGRTGCGKTRVLQQLPQACDLEAFAGHRGSAFGTRLSPQPAQIDFENAISVRLLKLAAENQHGVLEDEGRLIGKINLPPDLQTAIANAPLVILETPLAERVAYIVEDYVLQPLQDYIQRDGRQQGEDSFRRFFLGSLYKIRKRLGGVRYQALHDTFETAINRLISEGDSDAFTLGIERLLIEYYDPMYDYQLKRNTRPILFSGNAEAVTHWLSSYHP